MGITAQGATFTYTGTLPAGGTVSFVGSIVGLSVETRQAEVVDMTAIDAPAGVSMQVPTGSWRGGRIQVDYLKVSGGGDPQQLVRSYGALSFASQKHSVSRNVTCESATEEARAGDLVRGTLNFVLTDYTG